MAVQFHDTDAFAESGRIIDGMNPGSGDFLESKAHDRAPIYIFTSANARSLTIFRTPLSFPTFIPGTLVGAPGDSSVNPVLWSDVTGNTNYTPPGAGFGRYAASGFSGDYFGSSGIFRSLVSTDNGGTDHNVFFFDHVNLPNPDMTGPVENVGGSFYFLIGPIQGPDGEYVAGIASSETDMSGSGSATLIENFDMDDYISVTFAAIDTAKDAAFSAYDPSLSVQPVYGFLDCELQGQLTPSFPPSNIFPTAAYGSDPLWLVYPPQRTMDGTHPWRQSSSGFNQGPVFLYGPYVADHSFPPGTGPFGDPPPLVSGLAGVFGDFSQFTGEMIPASYPNLDATTKQAFGVPQLAVAGSNSILNNPDFPALYLSVGPQYGASWCFFGTSRNYASMMMQLTRLNCSTKYILVTWVVMEDWTGGPLFDIFDAPVPGSFSGTWMRPTVQEFSAPLVFEVEIPIPPIQNMAALADVGPFKSWAGDKFLSSCADIFKICDSAFSFGDFNYDAHYSPLKATLPKGLITFLFPDMTAAEWVAAGSPFAPPPLY